MSAPHVAPIWASDSFQKNNGASQRTLDYRGDLHSLIHSSSLSDIYSGYHIVTLA